MSRLILLVVLFACGSPSTPAPIESKATRPAGRTPIPEGWIEVARPDEDQMRCGNYSADEWRVETAPGELRFVRKQQREPDSGPKLPFEPAKVDVRGRRHVVEVDDGYIVGRDAGEWGGDLAWYSRDGKAHVALGDENVRGLVALQSGEVLAIEGLSHMMTSEGAVRWVGKAGGTWRQLHRTKLDAGPRTYVAAPPDVFVHTKHSLVRVRADRSVAIVGPLDTGSLYPDSMAVDERGNVWIGMRQYVLQLVPAGARYKERWYVERRCKSAHVRDLECICDG